jgi:hypothetical protein
MRTTARITAGISVLISGSVLLLAPADSSARTRTELNLACPGLIVDETCFVPGARAGTTPTDVASTTRFAEDLAAGVPAAPVELSFDKTAVADGVWQGTVDGDITGMLETRLTERRISGPIWHMRFDWIISAGDQSFVADLRGTLNNNTGAVVMNGTVVEGYLLGARVHEEGQLVDAATLRFRGSIRVMAEPAGA